jgi:hypothetical protein
MNTTLNRFSSCFPWRLNGLLMSHLAWLSHTQVGVETNQMVPFQHIHFHIFKTSTYLNMNVVEYRCEADVTRIWMRIRCLLNLEWI